MSQNLIEKIYSFMNILFFFPQLNTILNMENLNVRKNKYYSKNEVISNEIIKIYFPINIVEFFEQYNKYIQTNC